MSSYNMKIIEYADGTVQIKTYDGTVQSHRKKSKRLPAERSAERQTIQETTIEELIESVRQTELEQAQRAEQSLRSSVSRTRSKIEQLARSSGAGFEYFVTLTYSPKEIDRYDYNECIKKFTVWLQNIKRKAPNLQALFVPEFHTKNAKIDESGNKLYAIHFHGLMGQITGLELQYKGMRKGQKVYGLADWSFGISDVTKIESHVAICRYMRKYITKQSISIARAHKGRHRYFKTGLTPPKETKLLIDSSKHKEELQEEYIKRYADKNDMEIGQSMKNYSDYGYIPVKYIELKPKS